jgi:hypothetical protein
VGTLLNELAEFTITELQKENLVDSGWSRANWQLTVTHAANNVYDWRSGRFGPGPANGKGGYKPPKGSAIAVPTRSALPKLRWNDRVYVTNNVDYMQGFTKSLEQRTHFIALTMAKTKSRLAIIAKGLKK